MTTTHRLALPGAEIVYDVHGRRPSEGAAPPLLMIGQPMTADGFTALAARFPERTVVTYDPRGLGRSRRDDGDATNTPAQQADDLHALVEALGAGPVEVFASSGGAVTGLAWVTAHPGDVTTLVAHEPPLHCVVPDAEAAGRAFAAVREVYRARGESAGMAAFIAMTSWQGQYTDAYFARPAPDPAEFGMPDGDDGSRDSPLLSGRSDAVNTYRPQIEALTGGPTRVVIGVAALSGQNFTGRAAEALAARLGQGAVVFPSHHGGFVGGDSPYAGDPDAFAARLREVLAA